MHLLFSYARRAEPPLSRGDVVPLDTPPVPEKPEGIPPSPLHGRGGSGHKVNCPEGAREGALGYVSRGRGVKVRQSWTFTGNLMRRTAVRLPCLFRHSRNAAGDSARFAACSAVKTLLVGRTKSGDSIVHGTDMECLRFLQNSIIL